MLTSKATQYTKEKAEIQSMRAQGVTLVLTTLCTLNSHRQTTLLISILAKLRRQNVIISQMRLSRNCDDRFNNNNILSFTSQHLLLMLLRTSKVQSIQNTIVSYHTYSVLDFNQRSHNQLEFGGTCVVYKNSTCHRFCTSPLKLSEVQERKVISATKNVSSLSRRHCLLIHVWSATTRVAWTSIRRRQTARSFLRDEKSIEKHLQ